MKLLVINFSVINILLLISCLLSVTTGLPALMSDKNEDYGLMKRSSSPSCCKITNGCPNLDFSWRTNQQGIMPYTLSVVGVQWRGGNVYDLTIHVKGRESIPINTLWGLQINGINGPTRNIVLYSLNTSPPTRLITDPTDYTVTFQVFANADSSGRVWMPNFQFHY